MSGALPKDANGNPFHRAMGIPIVQDSKYVGSASKFIDMISLPLYRVFHGISVYNPDPASRLIIAIGPDFTDNKCMVILPQTFASFDNQTFGNFHDEGAGFEQAKKLRAKLDVDQGVFATGQLQFSNNPSDGQSVTINGITYEFTDDGSPDGGGVPVAIGASTTVSVLNLANAINETDQAVSAVRALLNLNLTAIVGGSDGNSIAIDPGSTGASPSASTLVGGSGGVLPVIHIW